MLTRIGLILDMLGTILIAIDIIGPRNIEKLDNWMRSLIEKHSPPSDDEKIQTKKWVEESSDRLKKNWPVLRRAWRHTSPHIKRRGYLLMSKFALVLFLHFFMRIFTAPIRWFYSLQKSDGVRIVPLVGFILLFVGFTLQFIASPVFSD